MEVENKIPFEEIESLLSDEYHLIYVDYRDSYDESPELIQECLEAGNLDPLWENMSFDDCDEVDGILEELKCEICDTFPVVKTEAKMIVEEYRDELTEVIRDRDRSDPVKDLLRNTSSVVMFYDTGYSVASGSWSWSDARIRLERICIKKVLQLTGSVNDEKIDEMIREASYGGSLVIYFYDRFDNLIPDGSDDFKTISFKNATVAIFNACNGSGSDCVLNNEMKFEFKRKNLYLDKSVKYNYTYAVCGMSSDWCDSTILELSTEPLETEQECELQPSSIGDIIQDDRRYSRIFKSGKCSFGDMDITRHRDVYYTNSGTCGSKCPHCGTFWID